MNSSSFINEIKQLFQVYLISVFIRNFVVDIQTKHVKNILTCFVLQHIYFIPFFKPVVWERERERERESMTRLTSNKIHLNNQGYDFSTFIYTIMIIVYDPIKLEQNPFEQ